MHGGSQMCDGPTSRPAISVFRKLTSGPGAAEAKFWKTKMAGRLVAHHISGSPPSILGLCFWYLYHRIDFHFQRWHFHIMGGIFFIIGFISPASRFHFPYYGCYVPEKHAKRNDATEGVHPNPSWRRLPGLLRRLASETSTACRLQETGSNIGGSRWKRLQKVKASE